MLIKFIDVISVVQYVFAFQTSCCILIWLKSMVCLLLKHSHLNVEADYLFWRRLVPEWNLLPFIVQVLFQLWGQTEVDQSACTHTNLC